MKNLWSFSPEISLGGNQSGEHAIAVLHCFVVDEAALQVVRHRPSGSWRGLRVRYRVTCSRLSGSWFWQRNHRAGKCRRVRHPAMEFKAVIVLFDIPVHRAAVHGVCGKRNKPRDRCLLQAQGTRAFLHTAANA